MQPPLQRFYNPNMQHPPVQFMVPPPPAVMQYGQPMAVPGGQPGPPSSQPGQAGPPGHSMAMQQIRQQMMFQMQTHQPPQFVIAHSQLHPQQIPPPMLARPGMVKKFCYS